MDKHDFAISTHFENIADPRKYNVRHTLIDIITISICALVCGAQNWTEVQQYGQSKKVWLKAFLELPNGIPSHDTFGRVFAMLDPKQFTDAFISWSQSIRALIGQIAIDGKTFRASYDNAMGKGTIHKEQASSGLDRFETVDGDHGRIETRRYATSSDIDWLQGKENWAGLKTIIQVQRERHVDDKSSAETSYYISSLSGDVQKTARAIRGHWQIENRLHWVLDMTFDEDRCRVRKDHAPANMAVLRHIVLNMIRQEKSFKGRVQTKRLKAGWENNYMLKILNS